MVRVVEFECPAQNLETAVNKILRENNLTDDDIVSINVFPFLGRINVMTNTGNLAQQKARFYHVILILRTRGVNYELQTRSRD